MPTSRPQTPAYKHFTSVSFLGHIRAPQTNNHECHPIHSSMRAGCDFGRHEAETRGDGARRGQASDE